MGEVRRRSSGTGGSETASLGLGDNPGSDFSSEETPTGGECGSMYNNLSKKEGEKDKVITDNSKNFFSFGKDFC